MLATDTQNNILYFSKYEHPKISIFWLFCLFIDLYRHVVKRVALLPHLYFILFYPLICFLQQIKTLNRILGTFYVREMTFQRENMPFFLYNPNDQSFFF